MTEPDDNRDTQRTGRFMLLAAWIGGMALMTLLFDDFLRAQFNPNTTPLVQHADDGRSEVVLSRNAQGHYVANGSLNGAAVTFLLDTGATEVALSEGLADRLGLPKLAGGISQTANGPVAVWRTRLDQVSLGSITLNDVSASILPSMDVEDPVLLGMSFLRQLEFEQRGGELTLRL